MCPIVVEGARWTGLSPTAAHAFCLLEVRRAQVTLPSALECDSAVKSTAPRGELAWPLINSCLFVRGQWAGKPKTLFNSKLISTAPCKGLQTVKEQSDESHIHHDTAHHPSNCLCVKCLPGEVRRFHFAF